MRLQDFLLLIEYRCLSPQRPHKFKHGEHRSISSLTIKKKAQLLPSNNSKRPIAMELSAPTFLDKVIPRFNEETPRIIGIIHIDQRLTRGIKNSRHPKEEAPGTWVCRDEGGQFAGRKSSLSVVISIDLKVQIHTLTLYTLLFILLKLYTLIQLNILRVLYETFWNFIGIKFVFVRSPSFSSYAT